MKKVRPTLVTHQTVIIENNTGTEVRLRVTHLDQVRRC